MKENAEKLALLQKLHGFARFPEINAVFCENCENPHKNPGKTGFSQFFAPNLRDLSIFSQKSKHLRQFSRKTSKNHSFSLSENANFADFLKPKSNDSQSKRFFAENSKENSCSFLENSPKSLQNRGKSWKNEVSVLDSFELVQKELEEVSNSAQIRKKTCENPAKTAKIVELDLVFQQRARNERFFQLCERGSAEDIAEMRKLLQNDPKKFLRDFSDPQHFLNKINERGANPLYVAARSGNLKVVQFLLENRADANISSNVC